MDAERITVNQTFEGGRAEHGEVRAMPTDTSAIDRAHQRLDAAAETLVNRITAAYDKFSPVLDQTERPEGLVDRASRLMPASSVGQRFDSLADLVERQCDRLAELIERAEL